MTELNSRELGVSRCLADLLLKGVVKIPSEALTIDKPVISCDNIFQHGTFDFIALGAEDIPLLHRLTTVDRGLGPIIFCIKKNCAVPVDGVVLDLKNSDWALQKIFDFHEEDILDDPTVLRISSTADPDEVYSKRTHRNK